MKSVYIRNTGRKMCRMSFIDDQKVIDKLEKRISSVYEKHNM